MEFYRSSKEGAADAVLLALVMENKWLIGAMEKETEYGKCYDFCTVVRFEEEGSVADRYMQPVFIEYDIGPGDGVTSLYRLHDYEEAPLPSKYHVVTMSDALVEKYDLLIIMDDTIGFDRTHIYGRLGTLVENEVVYTCAA